MIMRFFDLVAMKDGSLDSLARRLGYKKVFYVGKDVEITDRFDEAGKTKRIIRSENNEVIAKSLRQNRVLGLLPYNNSVGKKTLEMIRDNDKLFFIPVSGIVCADDSSRIHMLAKTRSMVRTALMAKVNIALISLAEGSEDVLSTAQMLEVAGFLGIEGTRAKESLSRLGELI